MVNVNLLKVGDIDYFINIRYVVCKNIVLKVNKLKYSMFSFRFVNI